MSLPTNPSWIPPTDAETLFSDGKTSEYFQALSDPNRLLLLARIATAHEPITVSEASNCCGVHISGVSRHLAILRRAGMVEARKRGRWVAYSARVDEIAETLRRVASALENCCGGNCAGENDGKTTNG